jgi:hypothetical protein
MDCDDGNADVHPGQVSYFETGYGSGMSNYDYDCNGREEKRALSPASVQVQGVCMCSASNTCVAPATVPTPCGGRGTECIGGADGCGSCYSTPSWVIQSCR